MPEKRAKLLIAAISRLSVNGFIRKILFWTPLAPHCAARSSNSCGRGTMEKEPNHTAPTESRVGATIDLLHDRITVRRFRESFARARWSDSLNACFVPLRTAESRIGCWPAEMSGSRRVCRREGQGTLSHSIRSKAAISNHAFT